MYPTDHRVVEFKGPLLHQDSGDRASARIQLGFNHVALGQPIRVGFKFQDFSLEEHHFKQIVNPPILLSRNLDKDGIAPPILTHKSNIGKFTLDTLGIGVRFVNFINGHNDRHSRDFGVVNRFHGLGHDAVVGGDNKNHQIRNLGAAGPHFSKRFMPRRIQKDNLSFFGYDMIGSDVLCNTSGFIFGDFGFSDHIEKRCLAMIHMSHYGNHRRFGYEFVGVILFYL